MSYRSPSLSQFERCVHCETDVENTPFANKLTLAFVLVLRVRPDRAQCLTSSCTLSEAIVGNSSSLRVWRLRQPKGESNHLAETLTALFTSERVRAHSNTETKPDAITYLITGLRPRLRKLSSAQTDFKY